MSKLPIIVNGPVAVPYDAFKSEDAIEETKRRLVFISRFHRRAPIEHKWDAKKNRRVKVDHRIYAYAITKTGLIVPRWARDWANNHLKPEAKERILFAPFSESERPEKDFELALPLRKHQLGWQDTLLPPMLKDGYVVGSAPCGSGKTVGGIWMISQLRPRTTLVVVNTSDLTKQWPEEIKRFLPKLKVTRSFHTYSRNPHKWDVLVTTVQTLMRNTAPEGPVIKTDLAIFDEVDVYAADKFSEAIMGVRWTKALGLTATVDRNDGLEELIYGIIGDNFVSMPTDNMRPTIYMLPYTLTDEERDFIMERDEAGNWDISVDSKRLTQFIQQMDERNLFLLRKIEWAISEGRKVLALSHWSDHIEMLKEMWDERGYDVITALRHGKSSAAELKTAGRDAQLVLGTIGKNKRGLNITHLDCMIQLLPDTDPRQPIGRIQRSLPGKLDPIVLDIVDVNCPALVTRARARIRKYRQIGARIVDKTGLKLCA